MNNFKNLYLALIFLLILLQLFILWNIIQIFIEKNDWIKSIDKGNDKITFKEVNLEKKEKNFYKNDIVEHSIKKDSNDISIEKKFSKWHDYPIEYLIEINWKKIFTTFAESYYKNWINWLSSNWSNCLKYFDLNLWEKIENCMTSYKLWKIDKNWKFNLSEKRKY